VGMHFHSISKDEPVHIHNKTTRTKAIHMEVDSNTQLPSRTRIVNMYMGQATKFLLGIAMRLEPELHSVSTQEE